MTEGIRTNSISSIRKKCITTHGGSTKDMSKNRLMFRIHDLSYSGFYQQNTLNKSQTHISISVDFVSFTSRYLYIMIYIYIIY